MRNMNLFYKFINEKTSIISMLTFSGTIGSARLNFCHTSLCHFDSSAWNCDSPILSLGRIISRSCKAFFLGIFFRHRSHRLMIPLPCFLWSPPTGHFTVPQTTWWPLRFCQIDARLFRTETGFYSSLYESYQTFCLPFLGNSPTFLTTLHLKIVFRSKNQSSSAGSK